MIVIGERVNATRKAVREAIHAHDATAIAEEIRKQDAEGAHYIDLNAGTGSGDIEREAADLCWLVDVALETTEKKFSIDTACPAALEKAVAHLDGRRKWMLNSVKLSDEILDAALPLAAEGDTPVVALAMDTEGIPAESERRIAISREIAERAAKHGIGTERLFFDPLVFPVSADITQGRVTLDTLRGIKSALPKARTTMGATNFSHGLAKRAEINRAFLIACIANGLDSAICDPTRPSIKRALLLGQLIMGHDRHCRRYSRAVRQGVFD
jgi:5-methyltetrahydrofolate corrinoid/iron sulfur protein methyltransferase